MTETRTLIKCKDYRLMKNKYNKMYMAECDGFNVGDEIIYFEYTDNVKINEIDDGFFIDVINIKQTYQTSIKGSDDRKGYFIQFRKSLIGKTFIVVKHPFSNDSFTGTEFLTYIETDECFIEKCGLKGSVRVQERFIGSGKELFVIPLFSDETEIFEDRGKVFIRSFCEELFTRQVKVTGMGYHYIYIPPVFGGLDVLLIKV